MPEGDNWQRFTNSGNTGTGYVFTTPFAFRPAGWRLKRRPSWASSRAMNSREPVGQPV